MGGDTGSKGGDCYDSAVPYTIVIGYTQVGGFHGQSWNNYVRRNSVTASQDPNGNPTVTTEVTDEMLNERVLSKAGSYTGVCVYGNDRVGGLVGNMNDYDVAYCYVGNNVKVEGVESVGGLCGQVYGWYSGRWETNNRMVYQCGTGAEVVGTRYVGGFIGRWYLNPYDPELKNPSNATRLNPRGSYEYALLFTGTIRGEEETTGWLVGACRNGNDESYTLTLNSDKRDGDTPTYGYYFQYCRIWEGSTMKVGTNPARSANHADYGFVYYYDALRNKTATERNQTTNAYSYLATMLVTAADLSDRNLYFTGRDYTWIGMGWDREYFDMWNNGSVATLFPHDDGVVGADFASYQKGIQQNGLVLWLDGRNNEGKGGTAKDATTWKDLTGNGYDAVLYWNNKSYGDAANQITVKERNYNMYWQDGGLEWCTEDKGYYAKLGNNADPDKNLSAVLNDGNYTVELVCTYRYNYTGLDRGILSWRRATTYGGFNARYGYNADSDNASSIVYLNGTSASTRWLSRYTATAANIQRNDMYGRQETYERSMAYVVDTSGQNEALGRNAANQLRFAAYYMNGRLVAGTTSSIPTVSFPAAADNAFWYLGAGSQSASGVRLLGVRVYDRVLTKEEIAQNAAYDNWYYFGKALDSAYSTGTTTRGDTGLWTSGGTLFRSSEYGYSGEWVEDNFTGDPTGYGRGYYYVRSGSEDSYSYSDIKTVTSPNYAPQLNRLAYGSDWYTKERVMQFPGQEGETTGDVLYSTSDNKNQGGYRMPDCDMPYSANELTAITQKPVLQMMGMARRRTLSAAPPLPQVTAYASGADRVNLELLADPAQGLAYRVIVDDDEVLAGAWPADSRTITMTWDYNRSFTLELTQNGTSEEHVFNYNDLARTVMTYGGGYWYLYGSECYDSAGKSLDPDTAFVHMLNGKVLDEGGGVHNAATGALTGTVTPYQLVTTEPVWSGRLALDGMGGDDAEGSVPVECFATYFVSTGGAKNTQLVVKGDTVYTMPASDVKIGSFVVDSYASSFYTTWLGSNGDLVDGGTPLTYPEDFGASNIRETSNTLGYDGHIMLVRYKSGKLVAFNYLSGEPEDVLSSEAEAQSLMDYVADTLKGLGGRGLLSSVSAPALRALTYENEVASNSSLRTALAGLSANENNTAFIDGPGTGVYGDAPGGLDIEPTNLDGTEEADGEGTVVSGQSAAPSDSDAVPDADSSGTMLGDGEDGGQGEIAVNGTSTAIGTGKGSGTGAEE
ncbi:MAG: hypothetical protein IJV64_05020, partial [Oscillospiraceae bacterium]|nr:hypothetical protein [Oscillospiraceae bacterium]